jgi:Baseplate J-like protein
MVNLTPKIDPRTAAMLEQEVIRSLVQRLPEFRVNSDNPNQPKALGGNYRALVKIFARFGEIILQRLNQVPDKNFLAFLDLLGASRLPPQPARVPLTFTLATGSTVEGVVPAGTQVAAPPAPGEAESVVFETERELVVTAAQLDAVFVRDPGRDMWGDRTSLTLATATNQAAFRGDRLVEHSFYIAHTTLFEFSGTATLTISITPLKSLEDDGLVEWQIWQANSQTWHSVPTDAAIPFADRVISLQSSLPLQTIHNITSRWIRCRLVTPITPETIQQQGMVRISQLPECQGISLSASFNRSNLQINHGFTNTSPIDPSKLFAPFGEKPKLGDTFYIAQAEAFSKAGAIITLNMTFVNAPAIIQQVTLRWEIWNGAWFLLGISSNSDSTPALNTISFTLPDIQPKLTTINGIESYWVRVSIISGNYGQEASYRQNGTSFVLSPATFSPPIIATIDVSYTWTNIDIPDALLLYNDEIYSDNLVQTINRQKQLPATIAPFKSIFPSLEAAKPSLYFGFTLPPNQPRFPNHTLSLYNHVAELSYGSKRIPLDPLESQIVVDRVSDNVPAIGIHEFEFVNNSDRRRDFHLSCRSQTWESRPSPSDFSLNPQGKQQLRVEVTVPLPHPTQTQVDQGILVITIDEDPTALYTAKFQTQYGGALPTPDRPKLRWDYWNGSDWDSLLVQDDTESLTHSGVISLLPPADFAPHSDFGLSPRHWLRLQWLDGDYLQEPQLQRLLLNTTLASQTITLRNEVLGSSDGSSTQRFQVVQKPVLAGPQLYVREPELPGEAELIRLREDEGEDILDIRRDAGDRPIEIWVRWHEVPDFYGSEPRDRHYVLDHLTGEVRFGNGLNGLIPPAGVGNLRLTRYQTGGGVRGNRSAGSIVQMKTTVPYVEKVVNLEPSTGGADAEDLERLRDRMPKTIRHRDRAVTIEDYEDLAILASPEVVRAKCIPLANLMQDPLQLDLNQNGFVSVIIVPESTDPKPLPSLELIDRVQTYLDTHSSPTASVAVVGPLYIQVSLTMTLALKQLEGASAIEQTVSQRLIQFLNPLTGGFDGNGWDFGRAPHRSDFYRLLESISGIDHVHTLIVEEFPNEPGIRNTKRFLVYSGKHKINLIFESG